MLCNIKLKAYKEVSVMSSVLPEPKFWKTRFQEFGLLRNEPKAEPVGLGLGESGAEVLHPSPIFLICSSLRVRCSSASPCSMTQNNRTLTKIGERLQVVFQVCMRCHENEPTL